MGLSRHARFALSSMALASLGLAAVPASAVDWGGYFRTGPGATSKDHARNCYALNAVEGLKYRLGNECD
ncbi:carbohydrate porin, partial [Piscinibacter terrae]